MGEGALTGGAPAGPAIEFESVVRRYGSTRAVDSVSFTIGRGEFFALLGPSGSGKTTSLRLIAGFEQPDAGRILLDGVDVAATPPYGRSVNTVFQDYALFPHLSVIDNVAYGLRRRGVPAPQARTRALARLEMVQLAALADRAPAQLSGGQRQRVALARALVNEPSVLLLDEPLGALDLKLREDMQTELKSLQRSLGITFVFVTHDQGEALSMADRVAVFNAGKIEQLDTPRNLYQRPDTEFVARFVGSANVLKGDEARRVLGRAGCYALRAEEVRLVDVPHLETHREPHGAAPTHVPGTVIDVQYRGAVSRLRVDVGGGTVLQAELDSGRVLREAALGSTVRLTWSADAPVAVRESP
jgi:putative spermidine/putrescine transport system ATP-binding protein